MFEIFFQVGLMRDGILLAEDPPTSLIQTHCLLVSALNKFGYGHNNYYSVTS